jgi:hypothetical protein
MLNTSKSDFDYSNPYRMFRYSIRNELTRRYYERRLVRFFDYIDLLPNLESEKRFNAFAQQGLESFSWALNKIIAFLQFQKDRSEKGEITPATLGNFVKAIKLFCEISDIQIPWKKITRGLPRAREAANDRAPTVEEIKKLIEYPDRRIKPIILVMTSSGIRIGSWEYLRWKHVVPLYNEKNCLLAAKIIVYAGDIEEYYSFITPEAYNSLSEWMKFRAAYGEAINGDSWLMRDLWQITNSDYGKKTGLAVYPKKLKTAGIKSIIERALREQGLRKLLSPNQRRHEWKGAHGFRKYYKTRTEQVMRPINVEITMGHNIGISGSYYKPTENEVMIDYLKAIDLLTINEESRLRKKVEEITDKGNNNEYIIKERLEEKDQQIEYLKNKYDEEISLLKDAVHDMQKLLKNPHRLVEVSANPIS